MQLHRELVVAKESNPGQLKFLPLSVSLLVNNCFNTNKTQNKHSESLPKQKVAVKKLLGGLQR